jgi:putative MATE family efflux protein
MLTNLLQVLYNAADMVIVSMSSEPDAVGAVGITGSFVNLVTNIFIGFSTGANVLVARYLGARNDKGVSKTVHTSILMSVIFGAVGALVGLAVARPILSLMGAEGKLLDLATTYTQIYFLGAPFISLSNYLISIFRAKGDTKTPLYILTFSGIVNVSLNVFFVLVCDLSVEGVSIATAISNLLSAILLVWRLSKENNACRFSFKELKIDKRSFKDICKIGLPAGLQGSLFSISNMTIQSSILAVNNMMTPVGSLYQPIVNGNAAASNVESFIYTATNSVYQASITFTSQNAGASKYDRIHKIMRACYSFTLLIAIVGSALTFIFKDSILSLYGVVDGAEGTLEHLSYYAATSRMNYLFIVYFLLAFMEVGSGVVRGLGKSGSSAIISLIGACVFRIIWVATVFKLYPTLEIVYLSYPISWALTALCQFVYAKVTLRKMERRHIELTESAV